MQRKNRKYISNHLGIYVKSWHFFLAKIPNVFFSSKSIFYVIDNNLERVG